jgi:superfamily I DNA/RNA helicase
MARQSWYINESELDDYQIRIIQRQMDNSFIVKGCAGSGKTVLALWRAKEIDEADLGSYYVIVYTKALRQFIDDGVKDIGLSERKVVHHWFWKHNLGMPHADYIIIDEVQDFSTEELTELQAAADKAFILFGDSAQQIYKGLKKGLMTMEEIAVLTRISLETLSLNHRLPKKIARVAEKISTTYDPLESRCIKEGMTKPYLIKSNSFNAQLEFIKDAIEEKGYSDVGLLFQDNHQVKRADEYYAQIDFKVESKYDIHFPDNTKFNLNFHSENPKMMTYHSAKGLQFEAVFLPNCNINETNNADNVNPLYVALTRTYQDLYILHSGDLSKYVSSLPSELFEESINPISSNSPSKSNIILKSPLEMKDDDLFDLPF